MTNNISTIEFDSILFDVKATHVKHVFQNLASHTNKLIGTPEGEIITELMQREKEMSSAIGKGASVSHMRLPRLTRPMIIFAKLSSAVDFKANDGEWVDMVCLVLSPEFEGQKHLQRLSMVTRYLGNKTFCTALRSAKSNDDIRMAVRLMNAERIAA